MNRNMLYFVLGIVLCVAVGAGVWMYKDSQREGVEISVGGSGVRIERR